MADISFPKEVKVPDVSFPEFKSTLDNLSEEEKTMVLSILKEVSEKGHSELLDDLKYADFEEVPVDIDTFLDDDNYLGQGL